jgi:mRNA interferase MazF
MRYVPERGDIVWINLNTQAGHEQAGYRPALVISTKAYNTKVRLMLCCPITHQANGYPFEVNLRGDPHVSGVVLADQAKCLDWQARGIRKKGVASTAEIEETLEKLKALLE